MTTSRRRRAVLTPVAAALLVAAGWVGALPLGCASPPTATAPAASALPVADDSDLLSIPIEYQERDVSAEAGSEYFNQYGVGDPYGSGFPWPIFLALLELFPDQLGGSLSGFRERFGFLEAERTSDAEQSGLPVGFHLTKDPYTRVDFMVVNCQVCHAAELRVAGKRTLVAGMGSKRVRIHAYDRALTRIAFDPRLDRELEAAAARVAARQQLNWPREWRALVVRRTLENWRLRAERRKADVAVIGDGLPGRVETIAGFAMALNHRSTDALSMPKVRGWTKIPDVAPWRYRMTVSFDGLVTGSPVTLVGEADFAFGVRTSWYEQQRHISTSLYLYLKEFRRDLPFPGSLDRELARAGQLPFEQRCARCHGSYGSPDDPRRSVAYREQVIPQASVGTDRARLDAVTPEFVDATNKLPATRGLVLAKATNGYVPRPLVNVWARGLYGHAGQWPDLATLATPPDQRPQRYVVSPQADYDLARVGIATRIQGASPDPAQGEYLYDASAEGFSNAGHSYLSALDEAERGAILEYLKTL